MSAACIGFPSFILTLEHTEAVNSTGFLRHVMRTALPGALAMVCVILVVQVLTPFWGERDVFTYAYNLLIAGTVGILVVVKVCSPMNRLRLALSVVVGILFCGGVLLFPGFLGIHDLLCWQMVLALPLISMVILLYRGFAELVLCCYRLKDRIYQKLQDLFPYQGKRKDV